MTSQEEITGLKILESLQRENEEEISEITGLFTNLHQKKRLYTFICTIGSCNNTV